MTSLSVVRVSLFALFNAAPKGLVPEYPTGDLLLRSYQSPAALNPSCAVGHQERLRSASASEVHRAALGVVGRARTLTR